MMFGKTSMIVSAVLSFVLAATVPVQAQMGSGPFCINDLMCATVAGAVSPPTCLGCPKKTDDSTTIGDCEFTLPEDSADTSKDGSKSKAGKDKKSRRRRRLKSSGDDDDDTEDGTLVEGMVYNANCCDCDCIQKTEDQACTCMCYGFLDPTDSTTIGGSSKDGKSKSGKDNKSRRRRRHLGSEDEEDLTVHDEETHVRSRLAKRADDVDAEAAEGGWHSWLLNSLWGSDDEELEVIDQSNRKLKKKGKGGKGSKKKSSDDDGDDDSSQTLPPTNEDGTTICPEPPRQCFYIKRREGNGATVPEEQQCQINTVGRCALRGDFALG